MDGQKPFTLPHSIPKKLLEDRDFQSMLDCLNIGLFVCDTLFDHIVSFTPRTSDILGLDRMELKNFPQTWGEILRSVEGSRIDEILILALDKQQAVEFDLNIEDNHKNRKTVRINLLHCSPVQHHEIFGEIQDVSTLREKEIALARMESQEVEISARIQKKLLLGQPRNLPEGLKLHASSIPSQQVDGDFYDFNNLSPTVLDFFVGDVMGKGLQAALLGAGAKNLFNKVLLSLLTSGQSLPELEQILDLTDSYLTKDLIQLNSFITLNYARIDCIEGILSFLDCGHNPVIHYSRSLNRCWIIKGLNKPLGFQHNQKFQSQIYPLEQGDLLFFYSDGITETVNVEGEPFGLEKLVHLIRGYSMLPPAELISRLLQICFNYSHEGFRDDVTALAAQYDNIPYNEVQSRHYPIQDLRNLEWLEEIRPLIRGDLRPWLTEFTHDFMESLEIWLTSLSTLAFESEQNGPEESSPEVLTVFEDESEQAVVPTQGLHWFMRGEDFFLELIYYGKSPDLSLLQEQNAFERVCIAESTRNLRKIIAHLKVSSHWLQQN